MKFKIELFRYNRDYLPLVVLISTLADLWDFEPDGSGCNEQKLKIELMLILFSVKFIFYKFRDYSKETESEQ